MRINLHTITNNNESIIEKFIDFYKQKSSDIIIYIWDINSTDKTIELAKEKGCIVKNYNDYYSEIDSWKNNCWKNIPTELIIICEIDEFIDLNKDLFYNCSLISTIGYDIDSLDKINEEKRNYNLDKICIFDPTVIKEMHFEGSNCNPQGYIRVGEKKANLYKLCQ